MARTMLSSLFLLIVLGYLTLCALLYVMQDSLIFHPSNQLSGISGTPQTLGMNYEDVYLNSGDGGKIHGWYIPHAEAKGTLLFLHGNAGNISHRLQTLEIFHQLHLNVFIIDYQGYGLSKGTPSEQACYKDALAAWHYLVSERQVNKDKIILFGRSMGGGVASWLADKHDAALLVLESTFLSIPDMAKRLYPVFPVSILSRTHFDTASRLQTISIPVIVIHSEEDEIVPFFHGKQLYESANEPKLLFKLTGDHNTGFLQNKPAYQQFFKHIIRQYL